MNNFRQELFNYLSNEHDLILLDSEIDEIINIVHKMSKNKLSPFDCDLCAMIENITKTVATVKLDDENITINASVLGMQSNTLQALENALKGRAGDRFISFGNLGVTLELKLSYDPEDYPEQYRWGLVEPIEVPGTRYCRKLKEVNAVFFEERNIDKVIAFTGGGTLTTPSIMNEAPDGLKDPATYEFPTENGTLLKVFEGEYIVKDENGRFSKMHKTTFENDFEPK